ncbi:acetyl-CoA acetyltransferase [Clostridia bacterium]|nr:acetyl-CoA acetyltransferase [Clostridia bacterium]
MSTLYIAAAKRTAIGTLNGSLSSVPAPLLGAQVVKQLLADTGIPAAAITETIVGNVLSAGAQQGVARQVAIHAGIPIEVPAFSVNMVCGSGMKAIMLACVSACAGLGDLYIAGGVENMSRAPYLLQDARKGLGLGSQALADHIVFDALTDAFQNVHMGITAENIAARYGITREAQDAFAYASQQKAIAAVDGGAFKDEIVPITVKQRKEEFVFDTDEHPNRKSTPEKLAALRPAFQKDGTVTAGNASGINDGAAFVLIATEKAVKQYNLSPLAQIVGFGQGGVEPSVMGLGPVPAVRNALASASLKLSDMDYIELNEAFAAQSLGVVADLSREHGLSVEDIQARTNVNGGAVALGHPVGASGARITVTLAHILRAKQGTYGLASLCIGGGMGTAVVLRRV